MKKLRFVLAILFMLVAFAGTSISALAADAEYRMMRGEQDAIVVGTIKEVTEDGCLVEKADVIMCNAENTLSRQLPEEEIPEELLVKNIHYHCSYHGRTTPQAGDHVVVSVDNKGDYWEQVWLAIEVSGTDIATAEVAPWEDMTTQAYAWQLFIQSDGEKVNFAYYSDTILYLDDEVIFDKAEHEKSLEEATETVVEIVEGEDVDVSIAEEAAQEELISAEPDDVIIKGDNEAVSISIIGGADGPTSIFIAGKLGSGFGVIIGAVVLSVVVIAVVVWKVVRRKGRKK